MSQLLTVAGFELKKRKRRIATYVHAIGFFAAGMLWIAAAGGAFSSASVQMGGKVFINGPWSLSNTIAFLSYFSIIITAAVMGQAIYQDFDFQVSSLLFTTRIKKSSYYFGRFLGAFTYLALVSFMLVLGLAAGTFIPNLEPARFTEGQALWYLRPYVVSMLVNHLALGSLFFVGAAITRRILPVYVASIVLFLGYLIASNLARELDTKAIAALLDPFSLNALSFDTQYWSIVEKNTLVPPLGAKLLLNRALWLAVGAGTLVIGYFRFRLNEAVQKGATTAPEKKSLDGGAATFTGRVKIDTRVTARDVLSASWLEAKQAFRNIYFLLIVLAGVLTVISTAQVIGRLFGTPTYPVTYQVLDVVGGTFGLFTFILLIFYTGELVWRERQARLSQIIDALPTPDWFGPVSKALALVWMLIGIKTLVLVLGVLLQLFKGYTHFELTLYARELFGVSLTTAMAYVGLVVLFHALAGNKFQGHIALVLFIVATSFFSKLGIEHHMFDYASAPEHTYSDMNGYDLFVQPLFWYHSYWLGFSGALLAVAIAFWPRGTETSWRLRVRRARHALQHGLRWWLAGSVALVLGSGAVIVYNTRILNEFRGENETHARTAEFEKKYKQRQTLPMPRIQSVHLDVAMYPAEHRVELGGTYVLENKTAENLSAIDVNLDAQAELDELTLDRPNQETLRDDDLGYRTLTLNEPLAPGQRTTMTFRLRKGARGFHDGAQPTEFAANGMFLSSGMAPTIGYDEQGELSDDDARRKQGLMPKERMRDLDDPAGLRETYFTNADWIDFSAHVSTSADQTPVAPGDATNERVENGRRHVDFKVRGKTLYFASFLSAAWAKAESQVGEVAVTIYHHPSHTYDLERMQRGVKAGLEYCSKYFGPYQHNQVRIVEFPRYATFAQSFPSTIPFSEAIGFIARVDDDDPKSIDYPFYVSVHEVAHQWWGHQIVSGKVQGATVLSETLAQYTALMAMKHAYGEQNIGRYLRYELDGYLHGRGAERKKELPLLRVENQGYIHYQKGSLVMFAVAEMLGEEKVNQAIARMLERWRFLGPPYPNSRALYDELLAVATPEQKAELADLFEQITLFDNRALSAKAVPAGSGYDVTLKVGLRKYSASDLGEEHDLPLHQRIEVGVKDKDGRWLLREARFFDNAESELTLHVTAEPTEAGIDPRYLLIDRRPEDNLVSVEK